MTSEQCKEILSVLEQALPSLGEASLPCTYLTYLAQTLNGTQSAQFPQELQPLLTQSKQAQGTRPFLSVLMRTQGKRPEMLKEVLLCLRAQSDTDFEVVLVLHKATEQDRAQVEAILAAQEASLRERIRVYHLDTGTRTAPLNLGAAVAYGAYLTCLDDDDLVLHNWVENFHNAALASPGRVIRCYGMMQKWQVCKKHNEVTLRSSSARKTLYCQPYDLKTQLCENKTPISCMAIPTACFQQFGLHFDPTLNTMEDWDYFMRCALLLGVHDTKEATFLYRVWENTETSFSLHREKEWEQSQQTIQKKLDGIPILVTREFLVAPTERQRNAPLRKGFRRILRRCKRGVKYLLSLFKRSI